MAKIFVINCRDDNWDACEKETIFGLKRERLPQFSRGDILLMRIAHVKNRGYGVKAIWYFDEAVKIDERVKVPWTDAKYTWKLICQPIIKLPRVFNEDFRGRRKLSEKLPGLQSTRIQGTAVALKAHESKAYLQAILNEFENELNVTFDYVGEAKSVKALLEELSLSLPMVEQETELKPSTSIVDHRTTNNDSGIKPEPPDTELPEVKEDTHLRIQYLLAKIGLMREHDVWVAKNDKNREYNGERFADICLEELPHFASQSVLKIAESIDVIWFRERSAQPMFFFEIEHTTTIYSGLLRLNDVKIDHHITEAYIVADDKRKGLFESQINRRTFAHNKLNEVCQFRNYEDIEEWYESLRRIQKIRGKA